MITKFEEIAFEAIKVTVIIKEFDIELIRDISKIYKASTKAMYLNH